METFDEASDVLHFFVRQPRGDGAHDGLWISRARAGFIGLELQYRVFRVLTSQRWEICRRISCPVGGMTRHAGGYACHFVAPAIKRGTRLCTAIYRVDLEGLAGKIVRNVGHIPVV